jgi:hypothetical protein
MKAKEGLYLVYCRESENKIYYIGYVFGKYGVFVTDEKHTFNYTCYNLYKTLRGASDRLRRDAGKSVENGVTLYMVESELKRKGVWKYV